jgi:hypothetical protein
MLHAVVVGPGSAEQRESAAPRPGNEAVNRDYFFAIAHAGSGGPNASSPEIFARIL